jgi:hypothetical protein
MFVIEQPCHIKFRANEQIVLVIPGNDKAKTPIFITEVPSCRRRDQQRISNAPARLLQQICFRGALVFVKSFSCAESFGQFLVSGLADCWSPLARTRFL